LEHQSILNVADIKIYYKTIRGPLKAVDGVSFSLQKGEILGLVGESGCGKTTLALAIVRLLPPAASITAGQISLDGHNVVNLSEEQMKAIRWKKVSIIFQGALNSLNPVLPVKEQIAEAILAHQKTEKRNVDARIDDLFNAVGLESTRKTNFPHEFSGGMKQRVMIAMALACNPEVIIADEPTTALDVIVQYQILDLIRSLRDKLQISMILITHDLSVVAELCDKIAIMYAGKIVESGGIFEIFEKPKHPYTRALLKSIPKMEGAKTRLSYIPGSVPDLTGTVPACRFFGRCPYGEKICEEVEPKSELVAGDHYVACHFWRDVEKQ
jgi:peptide/nickel transport system ATP-binding protein